MHVKFKKPNRIFGKAFDHSCYYSHKSSIIQPFLTKLFENTKALQLKPMSRKIPQKGVLKDFQFNMKTNTHLFSC